MKNSSLYILIILFLVIIGSLMAIKPVKKSLASKKLAEGISFYSNGDYGNSIVSFQKAVKLNKKLVEAYINLAKSQLNSNLTSEAFQTAQKLLEIKKDNANALSLCGEVRIREEKYAEATVFFDQAIAIDSNIASAFYYRGVAKANLGQLEASLADYKKAQQLDASNAEYLESSLIVRTKLDDYSGIIKDYDKILALNPSNIDALCERGYFKLNIDDYKGAFADFDNALKIDNKIGKAYYYRGLANAKMGNLADAAKGFNESARLGYKTHEAYFNAGFALLQLKKTTDARKALEACLKADNQGSKANDARNNLGVLELMNANYEKAVAIYSDMLKTNDKNADALFNRAYAYGSLKRYNEAIKDLTRCININYKTSEVYYLRAVYFISMNNYEQGCIDAAEAKRLGHKDASQLVNMYCSNK